MKTCRKCGKVISGKGPRKYCLACSKIIHKQQQEEWRDNHRKSFSS